MERIDLSTAYSPIELAIHTCRYLPAKNMIAGKRVLDIACGEGIGVGLLLQWGAKEVVGVDISKAAIDVARDTYRDRDDVQLHCADAVTFLDALDDEFDVVISVETVEHVTDAAAFLEGLAKLRKKGASVVLSCPNDYFYFGRGYSLNEFHLKQYSFYDFRTLAERLLGEAEWYFGTSTTGFSAIHVDRTKQMTREYGKGIELFRPAEAGSVPGFSAGRERLTPANSLFYLGIWADEPELKASYEATFPTGAHYRMPKIQNVSDEIALGRTRRVAFIIDMRDWAYDNIVRNMEPFLEGRYHITYFYVTEHADHTELFEQVFVKGGFDNVHVMWREILFRFLYQKHAIMALLEKTGLAPEELAELIARPVVTTSVYDHLFLREEDIEERQERFAIVDGYSVSSKLLLTFYNQHFDAKPTVEISDGVNLDFFAPAREAQAQRARPKDRVYKIGWVGNSKWGSENPSVEDDPKGLHSILLPAVERLAKEGYSVEIMLADRNIQHRTRAEMVDYYGEIDILVCASAVEGTPNPVLEAMASGIPFVSTDVGIVREAAGPLQAEFILGQRTPQAMYAKLKKLLDDPEAYEAVAAENLQNIQGWAWSEKTLKWLALFARAEETHAMRGQALRRAIVGGRLRKWTDEVELYKKLKQKNAEIERVRGQITAANVEIATRAEQLLETRNELKAIREKKDEWKEKAQSNWTKVQKLREHQERVADWKAKAEENWRQAKELTASKQQVETALSKLEKQKEDLLAKQKELREAHQSTNALLNEKRNLAEEWRAKAEANWRELQALKEENRVREERPLNRAARAVGRIFGPAKD